MKDASIAVRQRRSARTHPESKELDSCGRRWLVTYDDQGVVSLTALSG